MLSNSEGKEVVHFARMIIERYVKREVPTNPPKEKFKQRAGVFVTLNTFPHKELRGCIGIPEAIMPLKDALIEAAQSATHDPRFPPLKVDELRGIVVEVTVLTPPELIHVDSPHDYPNHVNIGEDGLIVEKNICRGLLLPQVPIEWGWGPEEFLSHTCLKAGLPEDAWLDKNIKIWKFQGEIFSEVEPGGKIIKRALSNEMSDCKT